jgi:hypothetical protein
MLGMLGACEFGGGLVAERAVWPALVVVGAPSPDDLGCFGERSELVLVWALVEVLAVDTLDISVPRRLGCLDQRQRRAVAVGRAAVLPPPRSNVCGTYWSDFLVNRPPSIRDHIYVDHPSVSVEDKPITVGAIAFVALGYHISRCQCLGRIHVSALQLRGA